MSPTAWRHGLVLTPSELTPADIRAIKDALTPAQTCALTAWGEARCRLVKGKGWVDNPLEAMVEILEVIDWRARDPRWKALGHKGVCLKPWQFSCWTPKGGRENFEMVITRAQELLAGLTPSTKLLGCLAAAETTVAGTLIPVFPPKTCHYYSRSMPTPPTWAIGRQPVADRHGHLFFANIT